MHRLPSLGSYSPVCADRRIPENKTPRTASDAYTHTHYHREADYAVFGAVAKIADRNGITPAQVALAWLLRQPGITAPIFGATSPDHVDEAIAALEIELNDDEAAALEAAYQSRPPRAGGH